MASHPACDNYTHSLVLRYIFQSSFSMTLLKISSLQTCLTQSVGPQVTLKEATIPQPGTQGPQLQPFCPCVLSGIFPSLCTHHLLHTPASVQQTPRDSPNLPTSHVSLTSLHLLFPLPVVTALVQDEPRKATWARCFISSSGSSLIPLYWLPAC